jgi:ABC-type multidrug transport system ATPase subunit
MTVLLRAVDLSFSYPGRHVLTMWSAEFKPGLTWLQGANGSGKSTVLKLLAGALPALTGHLQAGVFDSVQQPLDYRRQVFWCGPGGIAFGHLSATEFWAFMRGLYAPWDAAACAEHAAGFGLPPFVAQRLDTLSTGTQRKVWLCAALAVNTPVVLLDEPVNALDAASRTYLQRCLAQASLAAQQAWVVASHEALDPAVKVGAELLLRSS